MLSSLFEKAQSPTCSAMIALVFAVSSLVSLTQSRPTSDPFQENLTAKQDCLTQSQSWTPIPSFTQPVQYGFGPVGKCTFKD